MRISDLLFPTHPCRGLFEFGAYSFRGAYSNTFGMRFSDLSDEKNGMVTVWIIMAVEWAVFMVLAWYTEQVRVHAYEHA